MSGANNPQHAQGAAKKHAYNFGGVLVVAIISIVLGVLYLEENGDYKTIGTPRPRGKYDFRNVVVPRMTGTPLKIFASLLEVWPFSDLITNKIKLDSDLDLPLHVASQADFLHVLPTFEPLVIASEAAMALAKKGNSSLPAAPAAATSASFKFWSIEDYAAAYRRGAFTPSQVSTALLQSIRQSDELNPPLRVLIALNEADVKIQAAASSKRFADKKPLSIMDGVPVVIKDEFDVAGYVTTGGTAFIKGPVAERDASPVAKLRAAGAIIVGKGNMHEWGAGVTGINLHHGSARNPYNTSHMSGGSSSGSAAAVASGLVPVALGADGGGSIRLPAALTGLVGLKPTFGRVSEAGAFPLAWSVVHSGPLAASTRDAAIFYSVVAGPDSQDARTLAQPPVHLTGFDQTKDLSDLRVGVYWEYIADAEPVIVKSVESTIAKLKARGANIVNITIPDLLVMTRAHQLTIASEMSSTIARFMLEHRKEVGNDVRAVIAVGRSCSSRDYLASQKIRTYAIRVFNELLTRNGQKGVDLLLLPSTGIVSPRIPDDAFPDGLLDGTVVSRIMMYVAIPNFTGHPAISIPTGYTDHNLPLSVQLIGRHWEEHTLLRVSNAIEHMYPKQKPQAYFDVYTAAGQASKP